MTIISKALMVAATFFAAGTIYSESGFALGSDSNNIITASDIIVDPELIEEKNKTNNDISDDGVVFVDGTGDFKQEVPEQVNPEIGTPEFEAVQKAAEEDNNISASSLRELVSLQNTSGPLSAEMQCLAGTVYFESKSESLKGQLGAASSRFPNSICGVVYQRRQFSFVRGGKMPRINKSHRQWRNALAISKIAVNDQWKSDVEGALFFHATYVSPGWKLKRVGRIDRHIFYR